MEKTILVETKQMVPITRLLKEVFERYEIKKMIEARMENYDPKDTIPWEDIKEVV